MIYRTKLQKYAEERMGYTLPNYQVLGDIQNCIGMLGNDSFIMVKAHWVWICKGSFSTGCMLAYILGWFDFTTGTFKNGQYYQFHKSEDLELIFGMDQQQQNRSRDKLEKLGFIKQEYNRLATARNVNVYILPENLEAIRDALMREVPNHLSEIDARKQKRSENFKKLRKPRQP